MVNEHDCERIVGSCSYGNRFGVVRWDHSAVATSLASDKAPRPLNPPKNRTLNALLVLDSPQVSGRTPLLKHGLAMQIRTRREKVDGQPAMKIRVYFGLVS